MVGALVLLIVVQVQILVRQEGWSQITSLRPAQLLKGDATGQFEALMVAEELVPARHDYFREFAEPYFLIHWIPRRFWPNKPVMKSWTYYNNQYTQGDSRFNVTPSIIGQFYLNFGIFGVLYAGAFVGFLMVTADRLLLRIDPLRQRALAVAIGSFVAFILVSFRFYSPIYFTYFAFAWIGMLLITRSRPIRVVDVAHDRMLLGSPAGS
jgi:ABC-type multidrug transport system fused ATPase/permease subunit